jgi:hypothetical protein
MKLEELAAQEVDGTAHPRGNSAGGLGERTRFDADGGDDGGGGTLSPTTPSYRPTPAEEVFKSNEVESYGYGMLRNYEEFPRECSRKIPRH